MSSIYKHDYFAHMRNYYIDYHSAIIFKLYKVLPFLFELGRYFDLLSHMVICVYL